MKLEQWKNRKILILGFGREGQATLRYLLKNCPDSSIAVADQRTIDQFNDEEKALLEKGQVGQYCGQNYLEHCQDFDVIIKSPGINPRLPEIKKAVQAGVELSSATNIFFSQKKGKVIAVTGSKGKSTTASLIYEVLKAGGQNVELIGNIGRAALDFLEQDGPEKVYVFEISSYQLEDFEGGADIAVLVSFFPEHLDYHGSLESYFQAKMQLIAKPYPGQAVIYNAANQMLKNYITDLITKEQLAKTPPRVWLPFNDSDHLVKEENDQLTAWSNGQILINEKEISLKGRHNLENILAVYRVAKIFNISLEVFREAVKAFKPLEHRLEMVGEYKGIYFYNDAISTTPESTMAAIDALSRERKISTLIAGGLDRGYQFDQLAQKILAYGIENLLLLPETGEKIEKAVKNKADKLSKSPPLSVNFDSLEAAVEEAYKVTSKGHICLLSCASPSYNLFKNFEERGRRFKEAVRNLAS